MLGEIVPQDIEEVHQPRGYILRHRQVWAEWQLPPEIPDEPIPTERVVEWSRAGCVPELEKACRHGVNLLGVEFEEVPVIVDEDGAL